MGSTGRLPSVFVNSQASGTEKIDVDEEGKVRNFPHQQGQWVSSVFATLPSDVEDRLTDLISDLSTDSVKVIDDFHLTFHRSPIILRYHHIQSIVNTMSSCLSKHNSFPTVLKRVKVLTNDEQSRSFICACDENENGKYNQLVEAVNSCFSQYTQMKEYSEPFIFHVSLMWFTRHNEQVDSIVKVLQEELDSDPIIIHVTNVTLKVGNQEHKISLKRAKSHLSL